MVALATDRHPHLTFEVADAHDLSGLDGPFDVVILSDLLNDLWDVQTVFTQVARLSHSGTRVVINNYSRLWEPALGTAAWLKLARPTLHQNWLTVEDVSNLLYLANFELVKRWQEVLWPVWTPGLDVVANRFLVKLWPFNHLALTNFIVARPRTRTPLAADSLRVSVIVPARNEAGNIEQIFDPHAGDGCWHRDHVRRGALEGRHVRGDRAAQSPAHPERRTQLFQQPARARGTPCASASPTATGDVLMILDADLRCRRRTCRDSTRCSRCGDGEFVNGVRLVYPMDKQAMRFLNLLGNKFFSLAFSWLLGQSDQGHALRHEGALPRADYERIAANRAYFGDFDPFGDFDLLFGAATVEPADRRSADPLPRAHLRRRRTSSAGVTAGCSFACCCSRPAG